MAMPGDRGDLLVHPVRSDQIRRAAEPFRHKGHESYQALVYFLKSRKATLAGRPQPPIIKKAKMERDRHKTYHHRAHP